MERKKLRVILCALILLLAPALSWSATISFSAGATINEDTLLAENGFVFFDGAIEYITQIEDLPIFTFNVFDAPVSNDFYQDLSSSLVFNYSGGSSGGTFTIAGAFTDITNPAINFNGLIMSGTIGSGIFVDVFGDILLDAIFVGTDLTPEDFPSGLDEKFDIFTSLFGLPAGEGYQFALNNFIVSFDGVNDYVQEGEITNFIQAVQVPEPGTLMLLGTGLFGLILCRRRMPYRD